MTPKEKAKSLVLSFIHVPDEAMPIDSNKEWIGTNLAKRCALIAVEEILSAIKVFHNGPDYMLNESMGWQYWNKVRDEISSL